jgi:hypothetical protein
MPSRFLRAFLKRVKDVNRFGELRDVDDAVFRSRVDSDFIDTTSNSGDRLEIARSLAALHEE